MKKYPPQWPSIQVTTYIAATVIAEMTGITEPPEDAILFTVSGITVIADKKFGDFDLKLPIFAQNICF